MRHLNFSLLFRASAALMIATAVESSAVDAPKTERAYLSGLGPKDAVPWEFSVTAGRRAGEWTTIPVPSNWEQHGFGGYDYGEGEKKFTEHGLYRRHFTVPDTWKGQRIRLVFDGVMTDATVKVNGESVGPTHIGGFYRFKFDVTRVVKFGVDADNVVEVDVAKVSSNAETEAAERRSDYWVFGGIFRPVWLEAAPVQSIAHTAIDARADGSFSADVTLGSVREATFVEAQIVDADGRAVGESFSAKIPGGGAGKIRLATKIEAPKQWTSETPHLYTVRLALRKDEEVLHTTTERFGFRTFEVRPGDGFYLNGQRILLKGVNRHSFRPETARTLSREDCYADVRLLKELNMNSVRMSHYPPDEAFLEACDELGLLVLDELSGWQHAHGSVVGRLLIREMIERDVNHPSIVFWDNGNEGGWNRELDGEFDLYDPQRRRVLHPWELHDDVDTKHYPNFEELTRRLSGPHLLMPTEFIHALYDGGGGAGLEDYWNAIARSKVGGGGFIWVFADEGIVRTDQGNRVDVYATYAPDGIVGPHHEKEGSYYTVRDLWSPVQIVTPVLDDKFDGKLKVTNSFDFTSLAQCSFTWTLVRFAEPGDKERAPRALASGRATAPSIAPHATGDLDLSLPASWREADALSLTAQDHNGAELWSWTWPTPALAKRLSQPTPNTQKTAPKVETAASGIILSAAGVTARFDQATGLLTKLSRGERAVSLTNGPRLVYAKPASAAPVVWLPFAREDAATQVHALAAPEVASVVEVDLALDRSMAYGAFKLEITADGQNWKTLFDGTRRAVDGKAYTFPPQRVSAVRVANVRQPDGSPLGVTAVRLGHAAARFPQASTAPATITSGVSPGARVGGDAWVEVAGGPTGLARARWTLTGDGVLRLDYAYSLTGEYLYHGITFDHPESQLKSMRWLGEGPYRVWQNRLRGTWLGVHEIARNDIQPGESFGYPEFQGFFAGLRWAQFETDAGALKVSSASPEVFLRIGTPRINHVNTSPEFPAGDVSFLHAIPAIGSKFIPPEKTGPQSEPAKAAGEYHGTLTISLPE